MYWLFTFRTSLEHVFDTCDLLIDQHGGQLGEGSRVPKNTPSQLYMSLKYTPTLQHCSKPS
jgi:hypothetical protein